MHWRRFATSTIPLSTAEFEAWLAERWREKDDLLEYYMQNGRFPEDESSKPINGYSAKPENENLSGSRKKIKVGGEERLVTTTGGSTQDGGWGGPIETEVKLKAWWEVFDMFVATMWVPLYHIYPSTSFWEACPACYWDGCINEVGSYRM